MIRPWDASPFSKREGVLPTTSIVYLISYFAAGDSLRVRRVALDGIPRSNREELRRRFLEHPANLKLKGRGEKSLLWKAVMSRRCVCSCTASSARYGQS